MVTREDVLERLVYDAESGHFFRRSDGKKIGCKGGKGYLVIRINGKIHRAHRLAWLVAHGEMPGWIDHVNGDRTDNSLANLRQCNPSLNCANRRKAKNNSSGVKGVHWNRSARKWHAAIQINGKKKYLGLYSNKDEARDAYKYAASLYFGEFARPE